MFSKLIVALLMLITVSVHAANVPQATNVYSMCGINIGNNGTNFAIAPMLNVPEPNILSTAVPFYKAIFAHVTVSTLSYFVPFNDMNSGSNAQYQVPSGKKFYITRRCLFSVATGSSAGAGQFGYGTATFSAGTTAPTGAIYDTGATGGDSISVGSTTSSPAATCQDFPQYYPALAYPFFETGTANTQYDLAVLCGKEQ